MGKLLYSSVTLVWLLLMAVTLLSLWAASSTGVDSRAVATSVVILLAFIKIRFVGMYFMELREAPGYLRWIFHSWYLGTCTAILGIYLLL